MSATISPLQDNLPRLDPEATALRTAAIAALNRQPAGDLLVRAGAAPDARLAEATAWIRFRTGDAVVAIAPLLLDGALARVADADGRPDGLAAAAALDTLEPLVALVELALGRPLHPDAVDAVPPLDATILELNAGTAQEAATHRLLLALPVAAGFAPSAPHAVELPAGLHLPWLADMPGPAVRGARLAALGTGDLVLLGGFPLLGRLHLPGHGGTVPISVDAKTRLVTLHETPTKGDDMLDGSDARPIDEDTIVLGAAGRDDMAVRTVIELPGNSIAAGDVARLGVGSTLPLATTGGMLNARLSAGGLAVADGQIVALGEGYALLVTSVADRLG